MVVRKTVLVVDDDPALRKLVAEVLGRHFVIREAADGMEALTILRRPPPPDLVVLDVMMPVLSGFDVASKARAVAGLERLPIVFLTTKSGPEDVAQGLNAGARYYMTKPFKTDELVTKIKKILA